MIHHPSEYWEASATFQYSEARSGGITNPLRSHSKSTPKDNTMNRTRTPKALHPSIVVIKSDACTKYVDATTNRVMTEYATAWHVSAKRWAKDSARPTKAQRVPALGW